MIKFLVMILGATSVSWAQYPSYYHYDRGERYGYDTYKQKTDPVKILNQKITILNELKKASAHNNQICDNRQECIDLDQQSLRQVQEKYRDSHELQEFFQSLTQKIKQAIETDTVVTEWDVYNSMSDSVKHQYMDGVRINDPSQVMNSLISKNEPYSSSKVSRSSSAGAKFNIDDLKIYLLQQIEKNHRRCGNRDSCLQSDLKIIADVVQNIKKNDSNRGIFDQLAETMQDQAFKQSFNTTKFYEMYHDALVNQYSLLYKSIERLKWNDLVKNVRAIHRRDPQIINSKELKDEAKPENQMKRALQKKGESVADDFLGQIVGDTSSQQGQGLLGALFGK